MSGRIGLTTVAAATVNARISAADTSMPESMPKPMRLTDPAAIPARTATTPSATFQAREIWLSRRALVPVDQITRAAEDINSHNLAKRLDVPQSGDELQRLSQTLNNMLERLSVPRRAQ